MGQKSKIEIKWIKKNKKVSKKKEKKLDININAYI